MPTSWVIAVLSEVATLVLVGAGVYFVSQQVLTLIDGLQAFVSSVSRT